RHPELLGGQALVTAALLEDAEDARALGVFGRGERRTRRRRWSWRLRCGLSRDAERYLAEERRCDHLVGDPLAVREDDGAVEHVAQLAHVAWPIVVLQASQRSRLQREAAVPR